MSRFNTFTKHSYSLLAAAVVAAALGAAALPAMANDGAGAADYGGPGGTGMRGHMMMGGGGPMMGGPMMGGRHGGGPDGHWAGRGMERMLDVVNATADQRSRIKTIMDTARTDMHNQHQAGQGLRDQMRALFAQPNIDARAAEALRAQMSAQHDAASKRMLQARLDAAAVLTAEQRKLLAERMAQRQSMMERHRSERQSLERR